MSSKRNRTYNTGTTSSTANYDHCDRRATPAVFTPRTNWVRLASSTLPTLGLFIALGGMVALTLGTGCASKKAPPADSPSTLASASSASPSASVLDVHPAPAAAPAYLPPVSTITLPNDPVIPPAASLGQDPVLTQTPRLASAGAGAPASPGSYTVQKGDTLYKIAREYYGDGKQWSRIVSANPGLSPASLRAGQKLNLP